MLFHSCGYKIYVSVYYAYWVTKRNIAGSMFALCSGMTEMLVAAQIALVYGPNTNTPMHYRITTISTTVNQASHYLIHRSKFEMTMIICIHKEFRQTC